MNRETEADHILALAAELLEDIELDRLGGDKLLLKSNRLARLTGSDEIRQWIGLEMGGYASGDPLALRYMTLTGRWTNFKEKQGHWGPYGQQMGKLDAYTTRLHSSNGAGSGVSANIGLLHANIKDQQSLTNMIGQMSGIRSRVLGLLHSFASGIYYERLFADIATSTFENYKNAIDSRIAEKAGIVLEKVPAVVDRLQDGDNEAVSQALTTCRRIIEAFADAIYPPTDGTFPLNGNNLKLDASKHQNRINVYIAERTDSQSRRTRLRQNLSNLMDRVSTGVHHDISAEEAYALFLNVYLLLGEILQLEDVAAPSSSNDAVT